jgi:hypothetical protein
MTSATGRLEQPQDAEVVAVDAVPEIRTQITRTR